MAHTEYLTVSRQPRTWLQKALGAVRSYTLGPLTSNSKELAKYFDGGGPVSAGVTVTEASALGFSPVWSAVNTIADDVASLPLPLYKVLPDGGKEKFKNHSLYRILDAEPNPEMSAMVARRTIMTHALLWGNGYAEIERDGANRPVAYWPLVPERVTPFRDASGPKYRVTNPSGGFVVIDAEDMIHIVGPSHDGSLGASLVHTARESLGLGIAAEKFGSTFFGNGATFGGVISYKGPKPTGLAADSQRETLEARHQGVQRAHKFLALYNDATYSRMGIPPNDAQFLETRVFQIREVARWFKMPPHMLGDLADATYSNVEQMRDAYYASCLRPWLVLCEQEYKRKFIAPSERNIQTIEHVIEGFLRADAASRAAFHTAQFNVAAIKPNEIRALENRNPVPGGDRLFVMRNMVPLDRLDEIIDAEIAKSKALPSLPSVAPVTASHDDDLEVRMAEYAEKLSLEAAARASAEALAHERTQEAASASLREAAAAEALQAERVARADEQARMAQEIADTVEQRMREHVAAVTAEAARAAIAETTATERTADVAALTSERDSLARAVDEKARALVELEGRRAQEVELAKIGGRVETQSVRDAAESERTQLAGELNEARAAKNDTDVMLGVAERLRDEAVTARDAALAREAELSSQIVTLGAEREALRMSQAAADAWTAELRAQIAEQAKKLADYDVEARSLTKIGVEVNQVNVELRATGEAALERAKAAEAAHNAAVAQLAAVRASHRSLIVDTVDRLLQREVDRARKAQSTPEKLRAWIDNFYPLHEDTCRAALRPVLQAWAVSAGVDLGSVLDREVSAHVDESVRNLRLVAQHDDPETLAPALERVLRRWETERAASVADRLLREGEDACRKAS